MADESNDMKSQISRIGAGAVVLGALMVLSAVGFGVTGSMIRLREPGALADSTMPPLTRAVISHSTTASLIQAGLGVAIGALGFGFLRLRPWARSGLERAAWVALIPLLAVGGDWLSWSLSRGGGWILAGVLCLVASLFWCGALLRFIRALRSTDVRASFDE